MTIEQEFIAAMVVSGLTPATEPALREGELERFRVEGDKPGSRNGWCVLHRGGPIGIGTFGSWKTGQTEIWRAAGVRPLTAVQLVELNRQSAMMRAARASEQQRMQLQVREKAARLWALAKPATNAHAYLQAKGVNAYGIRQLRDMLLVPLRDASGTLHSLQFIGADGGKRFLSGGRTAGCYYGIGKPERELLLCEGLATGSTLFEATGSAVAIAFNCGNLKPVALALRAKFPKLRIVVCADDDRATPGNPGLTHGKAAARAVAGFLAVPIFKDTLT